MCTLVTSNKAKDSRTWAGGYGTFRTSWSILTMQNQSVNSGNSPDVWTTSWMDGSLFFFLNKPERSTWYYQTQFTFSVDLQAHHRPTPAKWPDTRPSTEFTKRTRTTTTAARGPCTHQTSRHRHDWGRHHYHLIHRLFHFAGSSLEEGWTTSWIVMLVDSIANWYGFFCLFLFH